MILFFFLEGGGGCLLNTSFFPFFPFGLSACGGGICLWMACCRHCMGHRGTRGLLLELSYLPCVHLNECTEVLLEMATNLLAPQEELASAVTVDGAGIYTRERTVQQHLELLRKKKLI